MCVNSDKSNIILFRSPSVAKTNQLFMCSDTDLKPTDKYTYLGLLLTEFLDYDLMAKAVAKSAGRALGLIIAKCKAYGGMPYEPFNQLFDSAVWPVIDYGAAIWGTADKSCIQAIQNRACRFFLGVGKYTPNVAVTGEMGRPPVQ